jgi:TolB-like protein/DNA-binding winged helix-turn-helix (wHTH) protein
MDQLTNMPLRIGDWRLDTRRGTLSRGSHTERLEARTLRLLVYLANRAGETVSIEELLDNVWTGVVVTPDSVYQAITTLRRLLGDDSKNPQYIATVPRLGYRLACAVGPWVDEPPRAQSARRPRAAVVGVALLGVALLCVVVSISWRAGLTPGAKSVAVLPFLDLTTQEMKEEYFADGLTEELIQRLSKLPDFEVPSPTASYYFKNKQVPIKEIADQLKVRYLLDGSLRESDDSLRISARLVRAEDGYVVWTQSYERPKADRVMIQDDIAGEVAQALSHSVR